MHHLPAQLSINGDCLSDFVESSRNAANIKDIQTGKYILSNYSAIEMLELQSINDLIGQTVCDIYSSHGIYKQNLSAPVISWKNKEANRITEFERQARAIKRRVSFKRLYFTVNGLIRFENMTKIPIPDHANRRVIAMLTYAQNLTPQLGLFRLLQLYREYYAGKQAIQQLLRHLKLSSYFKEPPTLQELRLLFALRLDSRHKYDAESLHLAPITIQVYLARLRSKLISTSSLHDILIYLRKMPVDERNI